MPSKLDDYNLKSKVKPKIVEKIDTRSKFYFPIKIGVDQAKKLAGAKKSKVFGKGKGRVETGPVSLFYEPFILVEGRGDLDYLRKRDYVFYVDDSVHSFRVGDTVFKPKKADVGKKIKISGVERINLTRVAKWLFNPMGGAERLDSIPSKGKSRVTSSWLKKHRKEIVDPAVNPERVVQMLRKSLEAKPREAKRILGITARIKLTTLYLPAYYVTLRRGAESKAVRVDGVKGLVTF